VTFFKTPKCDPSDQDPDLGAASESVDGELTDDDGEDTGEDEFNANSLPSDTVISDHIASVIMVDAGEHDDVSTMDNVVTKILALVDQGLLPFPAKMKKKSPMMSVKSLHQCSLTLEV
jgi:hypothetical protein